MLFSGGTFFSLSSVSAGFEIMTVSDSFLFVLSRGRRTEHDERTEKNPAIRQRMIILLKIRDLFFITAPFSAINLHNI